MGPRVGAVVGAFVGALVTPATGCLVAAVTGFLVAMATGALVVAVAVGALVAAAMGFLVAAATGVLVAAVTGALVVAAAVGDAIVGAVVGLLVGDLVGPFAASRNTGDSIQLYSVELFVPRIVSFTTPISAWNRSDFEALCVFLTGSWLVMGTVHSLKVVLETKINKRGGYGWPITMVRIYQQSDMETVVESPTKRWAGL